MNQQQIIQTQIMEQEAQQLNQQIQLIEQNIAEIQDLNISLDEINKKESKEILASLGKGINIPVDIKDKKLIVEVGKKNFVKKTIPETKNIIKEQLEKLISAKDQILERLDTLHKEIEIMMKEVEKSEKKNN